jgi:hypothetical protein
MVVYYYRVVLYKVTIGILDVGIRLPALLEYILQRSDGDICDAISGPAYFAITTMEHAVDFHCKGGELLLLASRRVGRKGSSYTKHDTMP